MSPGMSPGMSIEDLSRFQVLSFDCYGTLVDWESGILSALRPLVQSHGVDSTDDRLLELYGELEREAQAQSPFVNYRSVLGTIARTLSERMGFNLESGQSGLLAESLPTWALFSDTVAALKALQTRFKLAIISNVDRDLFQGTQKALDIDFDWIITSEDVGAYKPSHIVFNRAMVEIGFPANQHLHVAQSLYHDVQPARELGLHTVWVNRPSARSTPILDCQPDLEVPDLESLANLVTPNP